MFSKIKAFFVGVEHDVESIISGFTATVAKLEAAAEAHLKLAATSTEAAATATEAAATATAAADKATAVAANIKALVA